MISRLVIISVLWLAVPGEARAQLEDKTYPVVALASIMGELHFLSFNCQGSDAQDWRETMLEMLEFEAPTRGAFRERLIDAFNDGFYDQRDRRTRCGPETEFQQRMLAERGRALSEMIRRTYID